MAGANSRPARRAKGVRSRLRSPWGGASGRAGVYRGAGFGGLCGRRGRVRAGLGGVRRAGARRRGAGAGRGAPTANDAAMRSVPTGTRTPGISTVGISETSGATGGGGRLGAAGAAGGLGGGRGEGARPLSPAFVPPPPPVCPPPPKCPPPPVVPPSSLSTITMVPRVISVLRYEVVIDLAVRSYFFRFLRSAAMNFFAAAEPFTKRAGFAPFERRLRLFDPVELLEEPDFLRLERLVPLAVRPNRLRMF